ncbi:hypothetical protein QAD02_007174 [Eretmocerus hayati]|uniref:Uncharacterized protein n=1 Tax=Eretmocerus hayati TaxID=131215 RepID=A0ACC2N3A3_9HYME|nr:hypothetical protein QAD02_007174 [Eretmocerus hayati]
MVQCMKDIIKADRTGNWPLYVQTFKEIQPLFLLMDRTNYARWGSVYLSYVINLEGRYPEVHAEFMEGNSTVKLTNNPLRSIPPDQALEVTINEAKKGQGSGIMGST